MSKHPKTLAELCANWARRAAAILDITMEPVICRLDFPVWEDGKKGDDDYLRWMETCSVTFLGGPLDSTKNEYTKLLEVTESGDVRFKNVLHPISPRRLTMLQNLCAEIARKIRHAEEP